MRRLDRDDWILIGVYVFSMALACATSGAIIWGIVQGIKLLRKCVGG